MVLKSKLIKELKNREFQDFCGQIEVQSRSKHDVSINFLNIFGTFFFWLKGRIYLVLRLSLYLLIFHFWQKDVCGPMVCTLDMLFYLVRVGLSKRWCRIDCHDLSGLSCVPEIIAQDKKTLVEIMGLGVRIAWNLVDWIEMAFWAIIIALPWSTAKNDEFLHLGPKNYIFAVYSNFCFFNNSLLKSQNKVPLILEWLLRSVVYDYALNLILPFLVNFGILSPNYVVHAN